MPSGHDLEDEVVVIVHREDGFARAARLRRRLEVAS
jgi:hypothetical protein